MQYVGHRAIEEHIFNVEHDCKPISIDFDRSNVANIAGAISGELSLRPTDQMW